jgi:hypothetical protein
VGQAKKHTKSGLKPRQRWFGQPPRDVSERGSSPDGRLNRWPAWKSLLFIVGSSVTLWMLILGSFVAVRHLLDH